MMPGLRSGEMAISLPFLKNAHSNKQTNTSLLDYKLLTMYSSGVDWKKPSARKERKRSEAVELCVFQNSEWRERQQGGSKLVVFAAFGLSAALPIWLKLNLN